MRAREFIIEYDRGMTLKSWEQKLTARMASDQSAPDTIDEIMEMIESADPTRNKVYSQWIVKRYVAGDFAASDLDQVNLRLTDYDSVKKSLTTGKDINQLTYAQLPDIITAGKAQKTAPKFEIIPDTKVLYNGPDGQLAVPQTETASRALGSGTAWCTAYTDRDTMFDHYNDTGKLYTWRAKNGDKFQFFWGEDIQFMNSANKPMSPKDMHFYRLINPPTKQLFAKYEDEFLKRNNQYRILELLSALTKSQATWKEGLELIGSDPALAYNYSRNHLDRKPFPEGEAAIATSAEFSYQYAYMLNKPFPLGEPAIASSPKYSFEYAEMLDTPFPEGEAAIATSATYSYKYASNVLKKKPFPAGEAAIATTAVYAAQYAAMLKTEFPAGEAAIATRADASYMYAVKVLNKNRFIKGEAAIAVSPTHAFGYARDVIKTEWPEGERAIAMDPEYATNYAIMIGRPFPEGEEEIADDIKYAYKYALEVYKDKPFLAGESTIARWSKYAYLYAINVIKKRFPAGEEAISEHDEYAQLYDNAFGTNLSKK